MKPEDDWAYYLPDLKRTLKSMTDYANKKYFASAWSLYLSAAEDLRLTGEALRREMHKAERGE